MEDKPTYLPIVPGYECPLGAYIPSWCRGGVAGKEDYDRTSASTILKYQNRQNNRPPLFVCYFTYNRTPHPSLMQVRLESVARRVAANPYNRRHLAALKSGLE
jgi:hypothetical protein